MRDKMTEGAKARYDENPEHYELLRTIVKDAVAPINAIMKWYIGISVPVFGFLFMTYIWMNNSIQVKANESEVVTKMQYYQIEEDEHRMMLELQPDVNKATNVFNKINTNIANELGFRFTTRGGTK